jgi:hypothetical protein
MDCDRRYFNFVAKPDPSHHNRTNPVFFTQMSRGVARSPGTVHLTAGLGIFEAGRGGVELDLTVVRELDNSLRFFLHLVAEMGILGRRIIRPPGLGRVMAGSQECHRKKGGRQG